MLFNCFPDIWIVFFLISQTPKRNVYHSIKKGIHWEVKEPPHNTHTHTQETSVPCSFKCGIAFFNCDQIHCAFSRDLTYYYLIMLLTKISKLYIFL